MDVWLRVSVLLSASVALAHSSPEQASQRLESFTNADHVVHVYNRGSRENAAFRLLEVESEPGEGGALPLKFTIKETLCLKTEKQSVQNCDFKEDGMVKSCSASFDQDPPVLVVTCDSVTMPTFRTKRFRRKSGRSSGSSSGRSSGSSSGSSSGRSSGSSSGRSSGISSGSSSGGSSGSGTRTEKRKSQRGATRANPGKPGGWSAISKVEEHNPVRPRKPFQNSDKGNGRRTRGRKCLAGVKCKKERRRVRPTVNSTVQLRVRPTVYPFVQRSGPLSAEEEPLRPKRSPNTNGNGNGNRNKPKKLKCKPGDKCKKEPNTVGVGGFSAIAQVPSDSLVVA